jgi:hypothetical protein
MAAIFTEIMLVVAELFTFVETNLVPADAASLNIIHIAVWTPVTLGLIGMLVRVLKSFWGGNRGRS